jgi:hypothetical protein
MPPFYNDEPPRTTDADDEIMRSSSSILSHKTISYTKIETKVAGAETLSTRLLEDDISDGDDDDEHLFCVSSFNSHRPFMILSCFYMFLVTTNIIILSSSTEDFDSDNWWKISNICNVVSGYLGIMAAMYRSKVAVALVSGWWLFGMLFGMFRLACMYWSIIPNTPVRSWFIAYTVISYIVRLMLVCSASMFVAQKNGEQTADVTVQRIDDNDDGAHVVFV